MLNAVKWYCRKAIEEISEFQVESRRRRHAADYEFTNHLTHVLGFR